jgi:hypothetical protein
MIMLQSTLLSDDDYALSENSFDSVHLESMEKLNLFMGIMQLNPLLYQMIL